MVIHLLPDSVMLPSSESLQLWVPAVGVSTSDGVLLADSQTLFLRDNYRSTPEIVRSASTVLASCSHTRDPSGSAELRALQASGVPVSVSCCCWAF